MQILKRKMLRQIKYCISKVLYRLRSKTVGSTTAKRDVEEAMFMRNGSNKDTERHPWTFEVSWDVVGNVADMVTIRGDKNVLVGPYRPDRVENDVVESEFPPESPLAMSVQILREKGLKVITGKWLVDCQPPAILFDVESARSTFGDDDIEKFKNDQGIDIPDNDQETKDAILFGYMVANFLAEFELQHRSKSIQSTSTTEPAVLLTSISQNQLSSVKLDTSNSNPGQTSSTTGEETCAVFHDWKCGIGLILLHRWQIPVATVFMLKTSQLQGHYESEKRASDEARAQGIYHRLCVERGAAFASDVFSCVTEVVAEQAELVLEKHPDYVIVQD
ncbi:glycogen [starch] synthase-like [Daphnia carinata]|uniref:glycogen [starch] synthase-like n=1 Tax=Daphnia carinata TaxID=120202 RepID=UPI00257FDFA8|nr:glycogen [starch] synthase-like [Daphnia carinata]XP_057379304.1 glycogen [starch] synthase-like [Daphnia carinata]